MVNYIGIKIAVMASKYINWRPAHHFGRDLRLKAPQVFISCMKNEKVRETDRGRTFFTVSSVLTCLRMKLIGEVRSISGGSRDKLFQR